jgi:hypothetical protein
LPLTTSTASTTIREAYAPGFKNLVWRNNTLFQHFPEWRGPGGDEYVRHKVHSAGNDSVEIFTEGQAQPDAGNQDFVNSYVAWLYFRGMLQVTGHARDALQSRWIDHISLEGTLLRDDIVDLMTTSYMGSTYGIELSVDYGSAYAGITRNGAAGYWESTETAVDRALAFSDMVDLQETIRDNDKGGMPGMWLCSLNQESNIYRLTGQPAIKNIGPADNAPGLTAQTFNGVKVVALPDWSDTVICCLDMRPEKWDMRVTREFEVKEMAPSGDSDVFQLSTGRCMFNTEPKYDGKLTGVTA